MKTYINEEHAFACRYFEDASYFIQIVRHGRKIRLKVFSGDSFKDCVEDFFRLYPVYKGEEKQVIRIAEVRTGFKHEIVARVQGEKKRDKKLKNKLNLGKKRIIQLPSTLEAHLKHAPRADVVNANFLTSTGIIKAVLAHYATLTPAEKLKVFDVGVEYYTSLKELSKSMSDMTDDSEIL